MQTTVILDHEKVKALFEVPDTTQAEIIVGIFKMIYPDWNEIETLLDYCTCNERTNQYLFSMFIAYDKAQNAKRDIRDEVMPGGAWMNYGFSNLDPEASKLKDWHVIPAEPVYKLDPTQKDVLANL